MARNANTPKEPSAEELKTIEAAKENAGAELETIEAAKAEKSDKPATSEKEKMITIRLQRANKEQEDAVVWINERRFVIKRGVDVKVPISVAEALKHADTANMEAYDRAASAPGATT